MEKMDVHFVKEILLSTNYNPQGSNVETVKALVDKFVDHVQHMDDFHDNLHLNFDYQKHEILAKLSATHLPWSSVRRVAKKVLGGTPEAFEHYHSLYLQMYQNEVHARFSNPPTTLVHRIESLLERVRSMQHIEELYVGEDVHSHHNELWKVPATDHLHILAMGNEFSSMKTLFSRFLASNDPKDLGAIVLKIPALFPHAFKELLQKKPTVETFTILQGMMTIPAMCHLLHFDGENIDGDAEIELGKAILSVFGTHEKFYAHLYHHRETLKKVRFPLLLCYAYGMGFNNRDRFKRAISQLWSENDLKEMVESGNIEIRYWGSVHHNNHMILTPFITKVYKEYHIETLASVLTIDELLRQMSVVDLSDVNEKTLVKMSRQQVIDKLHSVFEEKSPTKRTLHEFMMTMLGSMAKKRTSDEIMQNFTFITEKMVEQADKVLELFQYKSRMWVDPSFNLKRKIDETITAIMKGVMDQ